MQIIQYQLTFAFACMARVRSNGILHHLNDRSLHFTFTILQAFPLYKTYMLGFGHVRKGS